MDGLDQVCVRVVNTAYKQQKTNYQLQQFSLMIIHTSYYPFQSLNLAVLCMAAADPVHQCK